MEALIRVAKQQSNIKFNTIKAYRALTLSDVPIILKKNSSIDVLIIEDMQPDEIEAVKELSSNFKGKVYTFGRIKLSNIDNFTSLSDLQDKVNKEFYIESHTYGSKRTPVIYSEVFTELGEYYLEDKSDSNLLIEEKKSKVSLSKEPLKETECISVDEENKIVEVDTAVETKVETEVDTAVDTEVKTEVKTEVEIVIESEVEPAVDTEVETVVKTEVDTEVETEVETKAESEVEPVVDTEVETEAETEAEPVVDTEVETAVNTEVNTEVETEVKTEVETAIESVPEVEAETLVESKENINLELHTTESLLPIIDVKKLNSYNKLLQKDKDLVDTLVSEINYYRDTIYKFSNSNIILNLKEQREEYQSKLSLLEEKLNSSTSLEELDALKLELSESKSNFESERKKLLEQISEIQNLSKTEKDNIVSEAKKVKDKLENELLKLKERQQLNSSSLDNSNKVISELEDKLKVINIANKNIVLDYSDILSTLKSLSVKYINLLESHNKEVARAQATVNQYKQVLNERAELETKLTDLNLELNAERLKKSDAVRTADLKLSEFNRLQEQLQLKLDDEISKNQTFELKLDNLEAKLLASDKQKNSAIEQVNSLLSEISEKNILIESKDTLIAELHLKLENVKQENEEALEVKQQLSVSDLAAQSLQKEIGRLQIENRENVVELERKDKRIGELAKANQILTNNVQALSRSLSTGSKLELTCKYSGKGFIIPVFGSGSYGVTTSSVSIAQQLFADGNSVLLMDMDLVSPKCNAYLNKPAIQPGLDEITGLKGKLANTCLGVLMLKDTSFFLSERHNLIQRISTNKKNGKTFDFFNGLYADIEVYKFANINWDELMNTLGNQYDYIVLDLGRFGGSNEQNALIKMFTSMSLRYLAITPKDKDDIRNLLLKINAYKLDLNKLVWMLNMSEDTKVDSFITEKALKNIPYRIITIKSGMIGKRATFTDALLKGQFKGVVDLLTLKEMK